MNNHIYTTKSLVLKSSLSGEANKLYFLFTQDFGLIFATAQGIRLEKSKLKGHLQNLSMTYVSLVKGKEFWRITSAEIISKPVFLNDTEKIHAVRNVFSLLLRLIQGEDKNERLFSLIENFYLFISNEKSDMKLIETLTVLRILYCLGYFKSHFDLENFAKEIDFSSENIENFKKFNSIAIKEINEALQATNL